MGNRYPNRNNDLNMNTIIGVRVLPSQKEKLDDYAKKHKVKISDIVRESITMWLNMNCKG
jgi:hypothetical protein